MMAISVAPSSGMAVCLPMAVMAPSVFSGFQVYQYAVNDDDGIVYQHTHCEDKCGQ